MLISIAGISVGQFGFFQLGQRAERGLEAQWNIKT
jgi:hypothetical protein